MALSSYRYLGSDLGYVLGVVNSRAPLHRITEEQVKILFRDHLRSVCYEGFYEYSTIHTGEAEIEIGTGCIKEGLVSSSQHSSSQVIKIDWETIDRTENICWSLEILLIHAELTLVGISSKSKNPNKTSMMAN